LVFQISVLSLAADPSYLELYEQLCEISYIESKPHLGGVGADEYFQQSLKAIDDILVLAYQNVAI
jgi:hypothetical protein